MGWILFLLGLGFLLLLLELFVTPGFLIGIFGLLAWAIAIFQVYDQFGILSGNLTTLAMILLLIGGVIWGLKTNIWSKVTIHSNITGRANDRHGFTPQVGMKGIALSSLRPMGSARFENYVTEVISYGELISQGSSIEIAEIDFQKIYVKQI